MRSLWHLRTPQSSPIRNFLIPPQHEWLVSLRSLPNGRGPRRHYPSQHMNLQLESPAACPATHSALLKFAIVYDDFASGTRAKHFAELLADGLACPCSLADSMWRSELLESPALAKQAAGAAADWDYLIVSLRGDRPLSAGTSRWIEAQLDTATERGAGLIILSDSLHEKWRVLEGIRRHLRIACAARDVPFFSHALTAPTEAETPRLVGALAVAAAALPASRWLPAPLDE